MKYRWLMLVVLATLVTVFAGCSRPETPQQVATEFWQALAEGKADAAAELSTLADTATLEGFDAGTFNTLPEFGRVVIEADKATIETVLAAKKSAGDAAEGARREITTYLVRVNDQWLVDYQRTQEAVASRSPIEGLKSDISRLREQFDDAVGRSSEQIAEQVDQLAKDFETYSEETGRKAGEALENFGESLKNFRKEIEEKLDEAEKERQNSREPDQTTLEQASI
ncbi:hypothetical protein [Marinobacter confluentis]|uniref:DUF4878 domain-containing protein n=1 Tax=Marinobacter confluentis TaxID=1697557 RepID=A0A4Z1BS93_9GAMM|nr:hypothetical protein [Marinobacter confluentis]TGN40565.1 hypothetical protein E5Q11_09930 [Marinobacter confluentis]